MADVIHDACVIIRAGRVRETTPSCEGPLVTVRREGIARDQ